MNLCKELMARIHMLHEDQTRIKYERLLFARKARLKDIPEWVRKDHELTHAVHVAAFRVDRNVSLEHFHEDLDLLSTEIAQAKADKDESLKEILEMLQANYGQEAEWIAAKGKETLRLPAKRLKDFFSPKVSPEAMEEEIIQALKEFRNKKRIQMSAETRRYTYAQHCQILEGVKNGLTPEQIALYDNPEYRAKDMYDIRLGLQSGLTPEQIELYMKPCFDNMQRMRIRFALQDGFSKEQLTILANPKFDSFQMEEIADGVKSGLTIEQINIYTEAHFQCEQMRQIRRGLENRLTVDQIYEFAKPWFSAGQMCQIRRGLESGLVADQINLFARPEFNAEQMWQLRFSLQKGLAISLVARYADPELSWERMYDIREEQFKAAGIESALYPKE